MRPCAFCVSRNFLCVISDVSSHCERYYRSGRYCELTPPTAEMSRIIEEDQKLSEKLIEAESRALRLRKQRRALR
jgi:hypothetical protein